MRPLRILVVAISVLLGVGSAATATALGPALPAPPDSAGSLVVRYSAPHALRVVRGFEQPAGRYGPGHRGVDLAARSGDVVRAAADGVVTFAGSVAGRGLVVLRHADGIRTEYEPLRPAVAAHATIRRGERIGMLSGRHRACAPALCLHWGARRGDDYLDPLLLLGTLGPVRLLPWPRDG